MTYLTLKFRNHKDMCEWIEDQEELMNNNPEPNTMLHYRKFDSIDWAAQTAQYVLIRGGTEE
jgi:hypothetical protein